MAEQRNLKKEIDTKLHDEVLQDALSRFADQYPEARLRSYANVDSIEGLRDDLRDMKQWTVHHIEQVADEFEASVKARGGHFFSSEGRRRSQEIFAADLQGAECKAHRQVEIHGV